MLVRGSWCAVFIAWTSSGCYLVHERAPAREDASVLQDAGARDAAVPDAALRDAVTSCPVARPVRCLRWTAASEPVRVSDAPGRNEALTLDTAVAGDCSVLVSWAADDDRTEHEARVRVVD